VKCGKTRGPRFDRYCNRRGIGPWRCEMALAINLAASRDWLAEDVSYRLCPLIACGMFDTSCENQEIGDLLGSFVCFVDGGERGD